MKIGAMTPDEFLYGQRRLRRERTFEQLLAQADTVRSRAGMALSRLADQRLKLLVPWWHQKFPTRRLQIRFGNGSEFIEIDGRDYHPAPPDAYVCADNSAQINRRNKLNWPMRVPREVFYPIDQALRDIDLITDHHRGGVPRTFVIEPIKKRGYTCSRS